MRKVLLVGDSISLDYGPELRKWVREDICIFSKPGVEEAYRDLDAAVGGNGGDSARVLRYVSELASKGELNCEYFFFNCGLHDIKRERPSEALQVSEADYRANLQAILDLMRQNGVKTVFITTTEADGTRYKPTAPFTRRAEDVLAFNAIAREIMEANGVETIDLYAFTASLGKKGNDLYRDHTHFNPDVIALQAAYLAGAMNALVK